MKKFLFLIPLLLFSACTAYDSAGNPIYSFNISNNFTGPQGPQGIQGIQGIQGPTGPTPNESYADVYEDSNTNPTAITLTSNASWYQWKSGTRGIFNDVVINSDNSSFTINKTGDYWVEFSLSYQTNQNNASTHWAVAVNGSDQASVEMERLVTQSSNVIGGSAMGLLHLNATDNVSLICQSAISGVIISVNHASFSLESQE